MSNPADSFFGGAPGLSYPRPNDEGKYSDTRLRGVIRGGVITDEPVVMPITEMGTGKAKFWDDGRPREQLVVTLRCDGRGGALDERDPQNPHDDGKRRLYLRSYMVPAVREALQEAGSPGLRVGGELYVCWIGEEEPKRKGNAWGRTWKAKYIPPTTVIPQVGQQGPATPASSPPADPWSTPAAPQHVHGNGPQQGQPVQPSQVQGPGTAPNPYQPTVPAAPSQAPADPWGSPPPAANPPAASPWG